jgi:integrase
MPPVSNLQRALIPVRHARRKAGPGWREKFRGHRTRVARDGAARKKFPTIEQVKHVIVAMPTGFEIERRNRALIAFTLLTGASDSAIASMKLKHIDLVAGSVYQDAREVHTKFSKAFTTFFSRSVRRFAKSSKTG